MNSATKKTTLIALGEFFKDSVIFYKDNSHIPSNTKLEDEIKKAA